jgi:hypothetical protein
MAHALLNRKLLDGQVASSASDNDNNKNPVKINEEDRNER